MKVMENIKHKCRSAYDTTKRACNNMWQRVKPYTSKTYEFIRRPISITTLCAILSLFTMIVYNIPVIKAVFENTSDNFNGVWLFISFIILMLILNFLLYYILLYFGRVVGKVIIAFTFICNALCLYFINGYHTIISQEMMGNVFNTRFSEASGFFSMGLLMYIIFLGVVPAILIFMVRIKYKSIWRFLICFVTTLAITFGTAYTNKKNILWIDRHATQVGGLLMPWSYTVNTILYVRQWIEMNRPQIPLPDGKIITEGKDLVVLVIGESARRDHFSLYGYERNTNPLLANDDVTPLIATSAYNYTTASVKAILDHKPTDDRYGILPNSLHRCGADVIWRTSNWGEPRLTIEKFYDNKALGERYPGTDPNYDEILIAGLKEEILASDKDKILVVLHTSTSHGPIYYSKSPLQFKHFLPECREVEMADANISELVNAYDNTIVYTDYILHSVIETLRELPDIRSCMLYVSDHGESLGEGDMFMHGLPAQMAPIEQFIVPFIVWCSDDATKIKPLAEVGQYHVFHSVLDFLGVESPIFNEELNIFDRDESSIRRIEEIAEGEEGADATEDTEQSNSTNSEE